MNNTDRPTEKLPLFALFSANAVSLTGNVMALLAIPWFVLDTTGSATKTGVTVFFNLLAVVLAGFFGGALVDRLGYRPMSVIADLLSAVTVILIPVLHATTGLEFWQLLALVFLGGLLDTPGGSARAALLPNVAAKAGWRLERATGVTAVIERGSQLAGAPLAGVLIAVVGPTDLLWINGATFIFSALAVWLAVSETREKREDPARYWAELSEGLGYLSGDRTLRAIIFTITVTNLLDAISFVILPVYARNIYSDPITLGLMTAALGAGSVIGALTFAAIGHRLPRRATFTWCFLAVSTWYGVAATFPSLGVMLAGRFIAGLASGPINPIIDTVSYERIPPDMRGRVFGVTQSAAWMAMPLGVLIAGSALDTFGLRPTLLVTGGAYVITILSLSMNRGLVDMDKAVPVPSEV